MRVEAVGFRFRVVPGGVAELKPGEDIGGLVVKLSLYRVRVLRVFNDVFGELRGVPYRAGEHRGYGVLVRSDDAGDLQLYSVVIEVAQPGRSVSEIGVKSGALVLFVAVRVGNDAEIHRHYLVVAPFLFVIRYGFVRDRRLGDLVYVLSAFEPERVEGHVVDFVVLIEDEDDFVIVLRPASGDEVVLLLQHLIYRLPVKPGEHLLPGAGVAHSEHRGHT